MFSDALSRSPRDAGRMVDCQVTLTDSAEVYTSRISQALRANYIALLTCALILVAAVALSLLMVRMIQTSIGSYLALLPASKPQQQQQRQQGPASRAASDDVAYASDPDAPGASNLQDSDNDRVRASIKRLEGKYAGYNAAMTEYATRVQGRQPDDLVDRRILGRADDDFEYDRHTDARPWATQQQQQQQQQQQH